MTRHSSCKEAELPAQSPSPGQLVADFYSAPLDALFRQETVAAVVKKSQSWCELKRWRGGGPAWRKIGHNVVYTKRAVLAWISQFSECDSTRQYQTPSANQELR
jgi:hypothetical protein